MCGFNGFIGKPTASFEKKWQSSLATQIHRGPDFQNQSIISLNKNKIFIAFQRLSIIDLTSNANQPMFSDSRDSLIVFNGEIFNYLEIKKELQSKGVVFQTTSDTEVLLRAIKFWDVKKACEKLNGMWSFVFIDLLNKKLFLSRDRFGEKPLYVYETKEGIYFSSEAKSLLAMLGKKFSLNHQVVGEFLFQSQLNKSSNYFLNGIKQISPSSLIIFSIKNNLKFIKNIKYWNYPSFKTENRPFKQELNEVKQSFYDSINIRMRSDVPIGLLFSGGLDSSSIASAVAQLGKKDTISFFSAVDDNPLYDESPYIDIMSKYLNIQVDKINLSFKGEDIFKKLEELIWINDQPLPSFSNMTHNLLIEKASKKGIKVMLNGQGADELFCGYRKYVFFYIKELLLKGNILKGLKLLKHFYNNRSVVNQFYYADAKRYINFLKNSQFKKTTTMLFDNYKHIDLGKKLNQSIFDRQIQDFKMFSIPQILHTEDRMSMAASAEMRTPFLDYKLVEKSLPLSADYKINNGWTKYILRKIMEPHMPSEITWRADKQNFGNSQSALLKGNLINTVKDNYLSQNSIIFEKNIFQRKKLVQLYNKFIKQDINQGPIAYKEIFSAISLEIWLRKYDEYIK